MRGDVRVYSRLPATTRRPHVAVVVPCYNYARYLEGCVRSIVEQVGVTTSVTILDDASTDDSLDVAGRLAERLSQVDVIHHATNRGHIATYNEGLARVDSDYVVLLSADDLVAPGAFERATTLMGHQPRIGLVYGHPQNFVDAPRVCTGSRAWATRWRGEAWITAQFRRGMNSIYSPEAVVRTTVHHQVGYYDPTLPHSGDLEMWLRIAAVSDVGRVNGPDQAYRRVHPASMSQTEFAGLERDVVERVRAYEGFLARRPEDRLSARWRATMLRRASDELMGWATSQQAGAMPQAQVDALVTRAIALDPTVRDRQVWADWERGPLRRRPSVGAVMRDVRERARWRRWRYLGV